MRKLLSLATFAVFGVTGASSGLAAGTYSIDTRVSGPDGGWDYAMVDSAARKLYLARDAGVLSLDLDTHKITPILVPGEGVHSGLPVGSTGLIASTNGVRNTVTISAAVTGKFLGSARVGSVPDAATFDPSTGLVAVMNHRGGTVSLVDAKAIAVTGTVKVGGDLEFGAASGTGELFVNVESKNQIAVINLNTKKLTRTIALKGCDGPSGLAYDQASGTLMSVCGNGVTQFIHAADGKRVANLKTGKGSDGVIFDADRKVLFVPAGEDGTLTVIDVKDAEKPTILQVLKTQKGARLGALDPKTGLVYLPTAKMGPPKAGEHWPSVTPGSFEFLVVGLH